MINVKKITILTFVILSIISPFFIFFNIKKSNEIVLNIYNVSEYMSLGNDNSINVNELFTKKTGIKINYSTFQTNEEMIAKILGGGADYDIIFPSEYMVERLIKDDMLAKIDLNNIPNYKFLCDEVKNLKFDPKNEYSIPYMWGVMGIFYNQKYVKDKVNWDILWNKKYSKKILMFDNVRDNFSIALFKNHMSVNSKDPNDWIFAFEELRKQRPLVQSYTGDQIFDKLIGEEAYLAPFYYGHRSQGGMLDDYHDIKFSIPEEGTNKFVDCVCILKNSKHKKEAEQYINFLYENDISYANSNFTGNLSPNKNIFNNCFQDKIEYLKSYNMNNIFLYENLPEEISKMNDELWVKVKMGKESYDISVNFDNLLLTLIFLSLIIIHTLVLIKKIKCFLKLRRCSKK